MKETDKINRIHIKVLIELIGYVCVFQTTLFVPEIQMEK